MDVLLVIVGIFLFLIGSAIENPSAKSTFKFLGAILFLVGALWFLFSFIEGYNNAIKLRK
ncbi:MAG: hypothetical protein NTU73_08145 [Ignavibacteriae bacterium]|nr:hypothetical protein [Ignavibacteriota bacterium]